MHIYYLGLGSNLGDCKGNLDEALVHLAAGGVKILRQSSLYETEPRDLRQQPWFLNSVIEVETRMFPRQLLARIHHIEKAMGRRRTVSKGPRVIDVDILLCGRVSMQTPELVIPHPRMAERRFVLEPLAELAPGLLHPATGETISELLARTASQIVRRLAL